MENNSILALTQELDERMTAAETNLQRARVILDQIATTMGYRRVHDSGNFPYPEQRELPNVIGELTNHK